MRLFVVALAAAVLAPCSSLANPDSPPPVEVEAQSSAPAADDDPQQEESGAADQEQVQQQPAESQVTCRTVRRRTESRLGSRRERVCTPVQAPTAAPEETHSTAEGNAAPEAH